MVSVSSKYQIVIPAELRERANIRPGTCFEVLVTETGLKLVRVEPLSALRGKVKRDDSVPLRDKEDRL
ncbi:MAG: AbrB/MazE/SpoVT family DNA-binding domain-containing protein [Myxococcota bacterium]